MRAHLLQYDIAWEDKAANHRRVEDLLAQVDVTPGDFVLLPEMFDTGFSLNVERTADSDGASATFVARLASRLQATVQAGITVRAPSGKGLNRAIVCDPRGRVLCAYDKIHPFSYGRESEQFVGGARVMTYAWSAGEQSINACPVICYDLRFPELFRAGLSMGAELFAIGANWPAARVEHWKTLAIARAIENQAFVLAVNRCGDDPFLEYPGGSMVINAKGRVLSQAGSGQEVLSVEIDPESLRSWRAEFPAWKDRSPVFEQAPPSA